VSPGEPAIVVERVGHAYGDRAALEDVSFEVARGERFALLGPNGGGKTTLFRILSTLMEPRSGRVRVLGAEAPGEIRRRIGVVFQSPSLDRKLTVLENLVHQGHVYGLRGVELRGRIDALLGRVAMADRAGERVDRLSGGQRRRVEIAKGLLHGPEVLLLDEPSTGLDPGARIELRRTLRALEGVTVLLTTHLMDEAEAADRIGILHHGRLVALETPAALKARIGGDVVTVGADDPAALGEEVRARFGVEARVVDGTVRVECARGHELAARLAEAFPGRIRSVTVARPTLEDVFIHETGRRFDEE
jgi:ABC-2 type transport system ATP-binding protein